MAHECGKCSYMGEDVYRYCDDCHAAIEHPAAAAEITRLRAELAEAKAEAEMLKYQMANPAREEE